MARPLRIEIARGVYYVTTRGSERRQLEGLVTKGKAPAAKIKHANILLKVDADGPGWTDEATAQAFRCKATTVHSVRQRFVEQGFEAGKMRLRSSPEAARGTGSLHNRR
ncbi:MAG: helix-turn-helix domain-containing protein [Planctomycetes bacterium]|nr:helix-turn-helix domain-containing protein [Planctomycetota bacterium]